jgi:signal transduction histidine kinase/DNA-binding response OmpR family regulator
VGTHTQGLCLFDDRTGRFCRVKINDSNAANAGNYEIWSLREDPDGNIWVGTNQANLFRIGLPDALKMGFPTQSDFTAQVQVRRYSFQPHATNIERLTFLSDGQLVVSTFLGTFTLDYRYPALPAKRLNAGEGAAFPVPTKQGLLWLSGTQDQIQVQRGGSLWVSTKGGGIVRLDKQAQHREPGTFLHINEAQGLPNKVVYGILPDGAGNLWLSTNRGLAQFNPNTRRFRSFTKADGLQDDEFNTGAFFRAASGELLFGGINGITQFWPGRFARQAQRTPPLARIIGLRVNNEAVTVGDSTGILPQSLDYTTHLDLAHDQNLLTLEFSLMDFTNSANNRYRYRLDGIDAEWVDAGTNRFANYAQLPDGRYTLEMMASPDGNTWSKPVSVQIRVRPPVYRTWWAYGLYALVLGGVAWQVYRVQSVRWRLQQQVAQEQREAARLAELDGLKTRFFTNISHEFRTPLTLLLGPIGDLQARLPAERPLLSLMERNATRLLALINQLLDLSKLEAHQLKPEPQRTDLVVFLRTLAAAFQSLAESRQLTFVVEQNVPAYWTDIDHDKLEKIVTNLLSNAFKFTPPGQAVRLSVTYPTQGHEVVLTVADTGIGMAAAVLPHIFERFYQADGRTNRAYEGTGVGLALASELVKVLGGQINVSSTEGAGTSFRLVLPCPPAPAPEQGTESPQVADGQVDEARKMILIVDDNEDIRAYVRQLFEADYRILEAHDGKHGLEIATATQPDLVICDLMMPRLDGFGFCRALKEQPATSHIPVVMLTAKATLQDRLEGLTLGADDYVVKPFHRDELQVRVRNLLQNRQRLFEQFRQQQATPVLAETNVPDNVPESAEPTANVPESRALLTGEQQFIDRLSAAIEAHLSDPAFSVEDLAEAANLSRSQLHRKLKTLLGTSATDFIRNHRLTRAAKLLQIGDQSVTQVAYAVGFDSLSYFARVFEERYGVLPSRFGKSSRNG